MAKRRTTPPDEPRTSRSTVEVRQSWLEDVGDEPGQRTSKASKARGSRVPRASDVGRPTLQRATIEVQDEWLESGSRPPSRAPTGAAKGRAVPPPLPVVPARPAPAIDAGDDDELPQRSAIPPPLPPSETAKKPRR